MNLRRLLLIFVLVGGFWYVVTRLGPDFVPSFLGGHASSPLVLTEAQAAPAYNAEELNNINVYRKVLPSVVNITSTTLVFDFFYGVVPQQGQGSGFVLDTSGHILTNFHVIQGANRGIEVQLSNKRRYEARVIGADRLHDLALLQIDAPNLQPVTLANSSNLQVGQEVYAIGNPFGLSGTMTRGIISSIRSIKNENGAPIEDAIQTDAAINPGNSGGPLLNSSGEVIGINTMIASNGADQSSGIGFSIPINTAKAVLADLIRYGHVKRPTLGIVSYPIGPDLAQQMGLAANYGVLIQRVVPGGPADRAGLRGGTQQAYVGNAPIMLGGDLIVAIDGQEVADPQDINAIMDKHQAGDVVTVTVLRGQRQLNVKVTLGEARDANIYRGIAHRVASHPSHDRNNERDGRSAFLHDDDGFSSEPGRSLVPFDARHLDLRYAHRLAIVRRHHLGGARIVHVRRYLRQLDGRTGRHLGYLRMRGDRLQQRQDRADDGGHGQQGHRCVLLAGRVHDVRRRQQRCVHLLLKRDHLRLQLCQRAGRWIVKVGLGLRSQQVRRRIEARRGRGKHWRVGGRQQRHG